MTRLAPKTSGFTENNEYKYQLDNLKCLIVTYM